MCLCVCLVRVETKTKWCVVESKVVFDTVHGSPTVSAVAEMLAFTENVGNFFGKVRGGPNIVCKGIVEGLRRRRAIGFVSATSANAIVIVGDAKRRRGGDFDNCLFFLFFGVRQHNPVRRVGKHNARFFAGILQTFFKVLGYETWNPEVNLDNCKPKCCTWNLVFEKLHGFHYCKSLMLKHLLHVVAMTHVSAIDTRNVQSRQHLRYGRLIDD